MNGNMIPTIVMLFLIALSPAPLAFADHDDGDDVEEYDYVLRFTQQDLSRFVAFIIEDEWLETSDGFLEIRKTIGSLRDPEEKHPRDVTLVCSGDIPIVIWGIPNAEVSQDVARWLDAERLHRDAVGELQAFREKVGRLQAFKETFGRQLTLMTYSRSPVLVKLLTLARCGVHFLKPRGAALQHVIEEVTIEPSSPESRIVSVGYRFEYTGYPVVEITADQAQVMTNADFDTLLNMGKAESVLSHSHIPIFHQAWVWFYGAPAIGAVGLIAIYLRKRRHGH